MDLRRIGGTGDWRAKGASDLTIDERPLLAANSTGQRNTF